LAWLLAGCGPLRPTGSQARRSDLPSGWGASAEPGALVVALALEALAVRRLNSAADLTETMVRFRRVLHDGSELRSGPGAEVCSL